MDDPVGARSDGGDGFGARLSRLTAPPTAQLLAAAQRSTTPPSAAPPPLVYRPPRVPIWVAVVVVLCLAGCGICLQAAVAAITGAVRTVQAADAQRVPPGFTPVGTVAGTTLWLRRSDQLLDLRTTGAVTVSCTSMPVVENFTRYTTQPLCDAPVRSGTVIAYAVDDTFHGATFTLTNGQIVDATVFDIGNVAAHFRLLVAVLPGVHTQPNNVSYR